MNSFEEIYETMLGLREEGYQVPGVENAFEEDRDLETMVTAMEAIQKELCRRIYQLR